MISVEQIRMLESKVQKAVAMLGSLQEENSLLKSRLGEYETRIDELEFLIEEFKEEQTEIEQGIISALNKLDSLESATRQTQASQKPIPPVNPAPVVPEPEPDSEPDAESEQMFDGTSSSTDADIPMEEPEALSYDEKIVAPEQSKTIELDIF